MKRIFSVLFVLVIALMVFDCGRAYANEIPVLPGTEKLVFYEGTLIRPITEERIIRTDELIGVPIEDSFQEEPTEPPFGKENMNLRQGLIGIPIVEPVYPVPEDMWGATRYLMQMGVVYQYGFRYTWYSERVLPGYGLWELNNNGRWTDQYGLVRDGEGYIAVANSDCPKLSIVPTPFGAGKVYDCGCASGTIDIYVSW